MTVKAVGLRCVNLTLFLNKLLFAVIDCVFSVFLKMDSGVFMKHSEQSVW